MGSAAEQRPPLGRWGEGVGGTCRGSRALAFALTLSRPPACIFWSVSITVPVCPSLSEPGARQTPQPQNVLCTIEGMVRRRIVTFVHHPYNPRPQNGPEHYVLYAWNRAVAENKVAGGSKGLGEGARRGRRACSRPSTSPSPGRPARTG